MFACILAVWGISGCAETNLPDLQQINRQQNATLASLQAEISRLNREIESAGQPGEDLEKSHFALTRMFSNEIDHDGVRLTYNSKGLRIILFDRILFDPESPVLAPAGMQVLDKLGDFLANDVPQNYITVEGYADNQPVESATGATNWEYAFSRAAAVLHYLINTKKVGPERLTVTSLGEYRPLESNDTEQGKDRNRRVEIVIISRGITDVSGS